MTTLTNPLHSASGAEYSSFPSGAIDLRPTFSLECFHNPHLPEGGSEINAIITVGPRPSPGVRAARSGGGEVIIVDVSGSMEGIKLNQARDATVAAIDCMADGVQFAVVAGNDRAMKVYPATGLVPANSRTRSEATRRVRRLKASGGTAIGEWISLATRLFEPVGGFRHAILLTDGKDEHETPEALARALATASGLFQCDCRGVGTDWSVSELRTVATNLLGSVDIVANPDDLTADFQEVMRRAMSRGLPDVRLRVWVPKDAEVVFLKQVAPELLVLAASPTRPDDLTRDYLTGAWGDESRDYHLMVRVPPASLGDEMLAARVAVVADGQEAARSLIRATWTDDRVLSTRVSREVAHYTGQEQLADAIQGGLDALAAGDRETAAVHLGRAVHLAASSGNAQVGDLLAEVVDVEDADTGRIRLKPMVDLVDVMTLDTRSTRTERVHK
jgi:VWA domain-containing protein